MEHHEGRVASDAGGTGTCRTAAVPDQSKTPGGYGWEAAQQRLENQAPMLSAGRGHVCVLLGRCSIVGKSIISSYAIADAYL